MTLVIAAYDTKGITLTSDGLVRCSNREGKRWIETDRPKAEPIHQRILLAMSSEGVDEGLFRGFTVFLSDYYEQNPPTELSKVALHSSRLAIKTFGLGIIQMIVAGFNHDDAGSPTSPDMYHIDQFGNVTNPPAYSTVGADKVARKILKERFHQFVRIPQVLSAESQLVIKASHSVQSKKTIAGQVFTWHLTKDGVEGPIEMDRIEVKEDEVAWNDIHK